MTKEPTPGLPPSTVELLRRMDEEMALRGFTAQTRRLYRAHVRRFYAARRVAEAEDSTDRVPAASSETRTGGRHGADPMGSDNRSAVASGGEVRTWLLHLLRCGYSHSYVNQALSALRFLHRAVLADDLALSSIPRPRKKTQLPKVLGPIEVRRFLDALPTPKHRAIAFVLYSTGLRVSECARLKVGDIDAARGQIHVRQGKGRKDRYVMLSPVVHQVLREYARVERPYDWLFPAGHRRDRHINVRTIQRQIGRAAERAGLKKRVTPHMLRHSFATHLMEGGTALRYIQELLGHTRPSTTAIYTHVARRHIGGVRSPVDRLFDEEAAD